MSDETPHNRIIRSLLLTHAGFALWGIGAMILCLGRSSLDSLFLVKYYAPVWASAWVLIGAVLMPAESGKRGFALNASLLALGLAPFITWEILGSYNLYTVICAHGCYLFLFLALAWQSSFYTWVARRENLPQNQVLVRLLNWIVLFGTVILYSAKIFCIWYLMSLQMSLREILPEVSAKTSPAMFRQLDFWTRNFERDFETQMEAVLVTAIFIQVLRGFLLAWRVTKNKQTEG